MMITMKKYIPLLFFAAAMLYSCRKNSGGPPAIAGTWYVTTDSLTLPDTVYHYSSTVYRYNGQPYYFQFNNDGTGQQNFYNASTNFTYSLAGNQLYFKYAATAINGGTFYPIKDTATIINSNPGNLEFSFKETVSSPGGPLPRTEFVFLIK